MAIRGNWCDGSDGWADVQKRKIVRCPKCRRRLLVRSIYCVGGEFVGWKVPLHKTRWPKGKK